MRGRKRKDVKKQYKKDFFYLNTYLPIHLYDNLMQYAEKYNVTKSKIVRDALENFLEKFKN